MSDAALALPFGHFPSTETTLAGSLITNSLYLETEHLLAVGYASGTILLYRVQLHTTKSFAVQLFAHVTGHKSAIVAFTTYEARSETGKDSRVLLSVSLDAQLCKWSVQDGRCLQSAEVVLDARPRGLDILALPERSSTTWLSDRYIIVYGCTTTITILSATTLETVVLWTSNLDWPLPLIYGESSSFILTFTEDGKVQGWQLEKDIASNTVGILKNHDLAFAIDGELYGGIKAVSRVLTSSGEASSDSIQVLLVCRKGLIVLGVNKMNNTEFRRLASTATSDNLSNAIFQLGTIWAWKQKSQITVFSTELKSISSSDIPLSGGERVEHVVAVGGPGKGDSSVISFFRRPDGSTCHKLGILESAGGLRWLDEDRETTLEQNEPLKVSRGTAAVFDNQMVFASGTTLHFYSLANFLLDFAQPSRTIDLKQTRGFVSMLKSVKLGEPSKDYLVVGMNDGAVYIVESLILRISPRLALHSRQIDNAVSLPHDMAPRLRSTIFITSQSGSAAVVDLTPTTGSNQLKPRTLLLLPPGRSTAKIISIATQPTSNMILILDESGGRRLWDINDSDGGGILLGDSLYHEHASKILNTVDVLSPSVSDLEHIDSSESPWRELWFSELRRTQDPSIDEPYSACDIPSTQGIPCALVNVRFVLDALTAVVSTAPKGNIPVDHVAILNARAVLTAILPVGLNKGREAHSVQKIYAASSATPEIVHRKVVAVLGQLGAKDHVSLLYGKSETDLPDWSNVSPTLKSVVALCIGTLLNGLLAAGYVESEDAVHNVLNSSLAKNSIGDTPSIAADLGVFVKYWTDSQDYLKRAARSCFYQVLKQMSSSDIGKAVFFWREFLPTNISPEFFNLKEVLRSVIVLSGIIINTSDEISIDALIDPSLRRNVALSIELFLADSNESYQNAAIEVIGDGWMSWQNYFDAFEVIHVLMRISANVSKNANRRELLDTTFLAIASQNSPLLVSGLGNCISHLIAPDKLATSTLSEMVSLSIAAMKTIIHIVRNNPVLFSEVELLKPIVEAIVKTVDPQAGVLRERVLTTVTAVVNELVDAYPTIAFHRPSQKLALSTSTRAITIYDLRNASPQMTLDGSQRVAHYLTFSQDGKYLVAVDLEESELYVWRIASNFLTSFIGAGLSKLGENATSVVLKAKHGYSNPAGIGLLKVEFTGERVVTITAGKQVTSVTV